MELLMTCPYLLWFVIDLFSDSLYRIYTICRRCDRSPSNVRWLHHRDEQKYTWDDIAISYSLFISARFRSSLILHPIWRITNWIPITWAISPPILIILQYSDSTLPFFWIESADHPFATLFYFYSQLALLLVHFSYPFPSCTSTSICPCKWQSQM